MNGIFRHPIRTGVRLIWFGAELFIGAVNYLRFVYCPRRSADIHVRAAWLQHTCRRVAKILSLEICVTGPVPTSGMLVSNHLSYLDIIVLSAITPCIFVAKREVRGWPIFGWFARLGGTVFADRQRKTQVEQVAQQIRETLSLGSLIVLFPEGTSSNGTTVLPFKSSLLEPMRHSTRGLYLCALHYKLDEGDPEQEVCYWREMTLVPHLINLMSKKRIQVAIRIEANYDPVIDRKELANRLHQKTCTLLNHCRWPATETKKVKVESAEPSLRTVSVAPSNNEQP